MTFRITQCSRTCTHTNPCVIPLWTWPGSVQKGEKSTNKLTVNMLAIAPRVVTFLRAASKCSLTIYVAPFGCPFLLQLLPLFVWAKYFAIVRLKIIKFLIHVDSASNRQRRANYSCQGHGQHAQRGNYQQPTNRANRACHTSHTPIRIALPLLLQLQLLVDTVSFSTYFHIKPAIYVAKKR